MADNADNADNAVMKILRSLQAELAGIKTDVEAMGDDLAEHVKLLNILLQETRGTRAVVTGRRPETPLGTDPASLIKRISAAG